MVYIGRERRYKAHVETRAGSGRAAMWCAPITSQSLHSGQGCSLPSGVTVDMLRVEVGCCCFQSSSEGRAGCGSGFTGSVVCSCGVVFVLTKQIEGGRNAVCGGTSVESNRSSMETWS